MEDRYLEAFFINPAIEYGIRAYLSQKEKNVYNKVHTFELYMIKALTIIYGEKSILLPYKIDNEKAFECNLLLYNLRESDMRNFLKYMNDYAVFMKEYNSNSKATGIITEIEKILMEMILRRNKKKPFTTEEIKMFDEIFNPINGDLKKIKVLISNDQGLIVRFWENKKEELTNTQVRLMAISPNLLSPNVYQKFGLDINQVLLLDELEIDELNEKIRLEEERVKNYTDKGITTKRSRIALFGNGYVNAIIIASVITLGAVLAIIGGLWK